MIDVRSFDAHLSSPRILATKVLSAYYKDQTPSYPINPFVILNEFDVIYQFRDFKGLEGVYLIPEDETDIPLIGINFNRPITRQRFTAAHELCHHIKDRTQSNYCPCDHKNETEQFADKFASELLMPLDEIRKLAVQYEDENGYVAFDDILRMAEYFGVSFQACVYRVAYNLKKVEGYNEQGKIAHKLKRYKPDKRRSELGLNGNYRLWREAIDSYTYFFQTQSQSIWYQFKNDFVYNENRLEGVDIDKADIGEILADLRCKKQDSEYCSSSFQAIIEVAGHAAIYDFILDTSKTVSAFQMMTLHQLLYQYAPHPEEAGRTRTDNNLVAGATFETADWRTIPAEIVSIDSMIKRLNDEQDNMSISEYVERVVKIHHRITIVHPFQDGNGRVSRAILNWQFKMKGIPPIYLKADRKQEYFDALKKADLQGEYETLVCIFLRETMNSMIQLNKRVFSTNEQSDEN